MNSAQKFVLLLAASVIVGMSLYPPWQHVDPTEPAQKMGYGFLWSPPIHKRSEGANIFGLKIRIDLEPLRANAIDWSQLLVQYGAVVIACAGLVTVLQNRSGSATVPTTVAREAALSK